MDTPKKNTASSGLLLTGIIVLIIISAFVPSKWLGVKPVKKEILDLSTITSANEIAKDTNGDGNVGWNEIINQTFKDNSTTEVTKDAQVDEKVIAQLNDPNNLTASLSKNLYLSSAYMTENNITDTDSQKTILTQLVNQEANKIATTNYEIKDLNIAKSEDKESLKKYGNDIAPIIEKVFTSKIMTDDITNTTLFFQEKNLSGLTGLTKKRIWVDGLIKNLLSVSTPPSAAIYHLLILNRISKYSDALNNISTADSDPIRAKIALDQYTQIMTLVFYIPNQLHNYFDIQNIVFSPKDAGYLFTVGYNIIK